MLLPGTYRARAIDWGLGTTASKSTPYTWVKLAVGNEEIDWQGWLSDRSVERTFEALRKLGWTGDDVAVIDALPTEVEIVIEHEEYQGRQFPRVRWINRIGERTRPAMTMQDARALADSLRARARAVPVEAQPAPVPAAQPPPISDDDIPF